MRAPLLEHLPGTRVTRPLLRHGWSVRDVAPNRPKTRFRHRPAKGCGFRRIEVPSTALEPTRMGLDPSALIECARRIAPPCTLWTDSLSRRPSRLRDLRGIAPEGRAFVSASIGASP